jgi:hypothetical protein
MADLLSATIQEVPTVSKPTFLGDCQAVGLTEGLDGPFVVDLDQEQ